ncbi:hypothetical protein F511_16637 [Dorcoceras hygrometricum]|uniref:Uncharacterized protein n=1 Tax=Dorcoceras hygrometricum TaxID=472368 RepID=A0A2Z7A254_9LAMI|nr:hypothetical protein F511_16637 [Dorcoceras hygrometricum]
MVVGPRLAVSLNQLRVTQVLDSRFPHGYSAQCVEHEKRIFGECDFLKVNSGQIEISRESRRKRNRNSGWNRRRTRRRPTARMNARGTCALAVHGWASLLAIVARWCAAAGRCVKRAGRPFLRATMADAGSAGRRWRSARCATKHWMDEARRLLAGRSDAGWTRCATSRPLLVEALHAAGCALPCALEAHVIFVDGGAAGRPAAPASLRRCRDGWSVFF